MRKALGFNFGGLSNKLI